MQLNESNRPPTPGTFDHWSCLLYSLARQQDRLGMAVLRFALVIVLCWIGALKFTAYQAEDIVPLVANSPLMSFCYHYPAPDYRHYMHREGEVVPAHHRWHEANRTYPFAHALGVVIVLIGVLIMLHPLLPQVATAGSFLLVLMSLTTLSFLVSTPEAWVPPLGAPEHGFPFLGGPGASMLKDSIMLGAAIVTMADSAKAYFQKRADTRRA